MYDYTITNGIKPVDSSLSNNIQCRGSMLGWYCMKYNNDMMGNETNKEKEAMGGDTIVGP